MRLSHSIRNTFLMLRRLFAAALLVRIGRGACGRRLRGHRFPHRPLCRVLQDAPLPLVGAPDLTRTLFGSASPGEKAPRFRMMAMLTESYAQQAIGRRRSSFLKRTLLNFTRVTVQ